MTGFRPINAGKPNVDYRKPTLDYGKTTLDYGKPKLDYSKPTLYYGIPTLHYLSHANPHFRLGRRAIPSICSIHTPHSMTTVCPSHADKPILYYRSRTIPFYPLYKQVIPTITPVVSHPPLLPHTTCSINTLHRMTGFLPPHGGSPTLLLCLAKKHDENTFTS